MKNLKNYYAFVLLFLIIIPSCKKKESNNPIQTNLNNGELVIINNSDYANDTNTLQSVYSDNDGKYKNYCYGSFTSDGKPNKITQVIINKISGDTSVNIFYDDKMRVKTLFLTVAGVKSNSLLTFDYSVKGKVKLSTFIFDFASNNSKLTEQIILSDLGNGSFHVDGDTTFKISQNTSTTNAFSKFNTKDGTDPFVATFVSSIASLVTANAVLFVATTAIGCILGKSVYGCVVGGIIGLVIAVKPANATTVTTPPSNAPPSPQTQTQGTQLQTQSLFVGTNRTSGVVPFDSGYYTVEYTDISFEVNQNKQTQAITSANFYATMNEMKQANSNPIPGYPSNIHSYSLNNYSISGNSITINFNQDATSFPQNDATFNGTINGSEISGTMTLFRISNGLYCVVYIPITVLQIN